jgi:hypothetical protein
LRSGLDLLAVTDGGRYAPDARGVLALTSEDLRFVYDLTEAG